MTEGKFFDVDFFLIRARGFAGEEAQERLGCAVFPHHEGLGNAVAMGWISSEQQPKAKSATKSLSEAGPALGVHSELRALSKHCN